MAFKAAHGSLVQTPGAATTFTGEACTLLGGTVYQINDTAKRIIDPGTALTVLDAGVADACTAANFLFGKATLTEAPGGAVTMTGKYLPLLDVALVRSYSLKVSGTVLDSTAINGAGSRTRLLGLQTAEMTLETTAQRYDDLDSGAGVLTIDGAAVALYATPMLVSVLPFTGSAYIFRGWFILDDLESKGSPDGLLTLSMKLSGHVRTGTVGTGSTAVTVGFGWT